MITDALYNVMTNVAGNITNGATRDRLWNLILWMRDDAYEYDFDITLDGKVAVKVISDGTLREFTLAKFLGKHWSVLDVNVASRSELKPEIDAICAAATSWPKRSMYSHKLLSGEDINDPYIDIHTCMSGAENSLALYKENPDRVKLMTIFRGTGNNQLLQGRALVWTTDEGKTLLDRVYPSDMGPHTKYAREIAQSKGWDYRVTDHAWEPEVASGEFHTVTLRNVNSFPWMDTLRFMKKSEGEDLITVTNDGSDPDRQVMQSQFAHDPFLPACQSCHDEDTSGVPFRGANFIEEYDIYVCNRCRNRYRWSDRLGRNVWIDDPDFYYNGSNNEYYTAEEWDSVQEEIRREELTRQRRIVGRMHGYMASAIHESEHYMGDWVISNPPRLTRRRSVRSLSESIRILTEDNGSNWTQHALRYDSLAGLQHDNWAGWSIAEHEEAEIESDNSNRTP